MELPSGLDSKFRFILIAAKRARQLQAGAKPLVQTPYKKSTKVAMAELSSGLLPIEVPPPDVPGPSKNGKEGS
jgi:DNA-directed RNA polymerase subunit omega